VRPQFGEWQGFVKYPAKQKGKYPGRVKRYTVNHPGLNHAIELRKTSDKTVNEICSITGISPATFYRRLKEIEEDF
jgi:DNA invertase Pin-like site-specific DNA recombinase